MSEFEIERDDGETGGRYVVRRNGEDAEMTYSRAGPSRIIIDHTGVPESMRGMQVGLALLERAVEEARADAVKIIPLCPFARATLAKHPEWQDVVQ